jgi:hypothetical protein
MAVFGGSFVGLMLLPVSFPIFPSLISGPFQHGLIVVFAFATVLSALAALASALRGARPGQAPAGPD